jgi:hypothetical protein
VSISLETYFWPTIMRRTPGVAVCRRDTVNLVQ